jgi:hypothetical protein
MSTGSEYLRDLTQRFTDLKTMADRAVAQVPDGALWATLDPESNSIGVLVRHLAGNMQSRWRDFLTSDGEKPDRQRDREFQAPDDQSRAAILADWESAWALLFSELGRLTAADLDRTVTARHEPMSVVSAVNRQFGHAAQHIGQIVLLAKHSRAGAWQTLSIARGQSEAFNEKMRQQFQPSAGRGPKA